MRVNIKIHSLRKYFFIYLCETIVNFRYLYYSQHDLLYQLDSNYSRNKINQFFTILYKQRHKFYMDTIIYISLP